jgi:hypothetical protein
MLFIGLEARKSYVFLLGRTRTKVRKETRPSSMCSAISQNQQFTSSSSDEEDAKKEVKSYMQVA